MRLKRKIINFLTTFPGVGKKTAQQIILDLKGKLHEFLHDFPEKSETTQHIEKKRELEEALLALEALGYSSREINRIKNGLANEKLTTNEYIKLALKKLSNS